MAKGDRTTRFIPSAPPGRDTESWNTYNDFVKVFDWMRQPVAFEMGFEVLHAAPVKPFVGLVVYADGTNWNPGSGEGLYVYKSGGWALLG